MVFFVVLNQYFVLSKRINERDYHQSTIKLSQEKKKKKKQKIITDNRNEE
jgi:hypothetical protein